jgi:L-histidine N-alpha-methyltransferase
MPRAAPQRRAPADSRDAEISRLRRAVRDGLTRARKSLPPWLFYDAEGSRLYELITELPEYYPTRTERRILEDHADAIVARAAAGAPSVHALELGAGTATKSQLLLGAIARRQPRVLYRPCDVSPEPLALATARIEREEPRVTVRPVVGHHEAAIAALCALPERQLCMFLGSSIGNHEGGEAVDLLARVARALHPGGVLLLGTDLRKSARVLVPAYDDAAGVTAAFNLNVLVRINRELGGHFELGRFRHVAVWNEQASRMEMHLESTVDQIVCVDGLGLDLSFARGERIHTESSVKYDEPMVDHLLDAAGLVREESFRDREDLFAVHVARKTSGK